MTDANGRNRLTRRRFLQNAAAGGAALLGQSAKKRARAQGEPPSMPENYQNAEAYPFLVKQPVYKAQITPHWFGDNSRFWYRNDLPRRTKAFILVDAARGTRGPAFDHAKLAAALTRASGTPYRADRLPFNAIAFPDDHTVRFEVGDSAWQCDLTTYVVTPLPHSPSPEPPQEDAPTDPPDPAGDETGGLLSPDGQWTAFVRDHNVFVQAKGAAEAVPVTQDGTGDHTYGELRWSPDSQALVGFRIHPVPIKPVFLIESSPKEWSSRGILHQHEYAQAGDPFTTFEMWLFDPAARHATKAQVDVIDFNGPPDMNWLDDGRRFTYEKMDRGYQRFRVISVDSRTGQAQAVIDDQAQTFIDSTNVYTSYQKTPLADEILYASERDGWRHLYLYDRAGGRLENQVTRGEWVVRGVDRVDPDTRQIWFRASGKNPGEDPYQMHVYRVGFDGSGLTALTEGNGTHTVQWSPNRNYLIDTYSRPDLPPVHTLRRESAGTLVCPLETADISALTSRGWRPPEVFSAKGRDGRTDIWGNVFLPMHFDLHKKYPVIENIYAGPQDSFTRKTFVVNDSMQSLAELGFIVVQCDGMGTRNRSKAFHDVCWHNLKDAGLPDRIAWITALARKHPQADLGRVGIYGTSAGGQSSTGALLFHPEFYKVGVSSCGCHDNRIDKQWWNEQWMGYPVGPWYADNSNITHAANLRGKLLLIVGELDTNVPPESTIRLTDALIKAGKDYELIIITGSDHTDGGPYGERRRRDFFVRHLLGLEPPDRNIPVPPVRLTPQPASAEEDALPGGGDGTTVTFVNHSAHEVRLYWLPGDGTRTGYGALAPGATHTQNTYAGHSWLVATEDGRGLAVFVADSRPGIADIK